MEDSGQRSLEPGGVTWSGAARDEEVRASIREAGHQEFAEVRKGAQGSRLSDHVRGSGILEISPASDGCQGAEGDLRHWYQRLLSQDGEVEHDHRFRREV